MPRMLLDILQGLGWPYNRESMGLKCRQGHCLKPRNPDMQSSVLARSFWSTEKACAHLPRTRLGKLEGQIVYFCWPGVMGKLTAVFSLALLG